MKLHYSCFYFVIFTYVVARQKTITIIQNKIYIYLGKSTQNNFENINHKKNAQCISECANLTRCLPIWLNALSTFSRCSSSSIFFQYIFTMYLLYRFVWIAIEMHYFLLSSFSILTFNQVPIGINQRSQCHFSIYK